MAAVELDFKRKRFVLSQISSTLTDHRYERYDNMFPGVTFTSFEEDVALATFRLCFSIYIYSTETLAKVLQLVIGVVAHRAYVELFI